MTTDVQQKLKDSISKLNYIYNLQDQETWYLDVTKLQKHDIAYVNNEFIKKIGIDFIELGISLSSFFQKPEDLTIQLYKFNETLTRLLHKTGDRPIALNYHYRTIAEEGSSIQSDGVTRDHQLSLNDDDDVYGNGGSLMTNLDHGLIVKTLIKTIVVKIMDLESLIRSGGVVSPLTKIQSQLIDDILLKNISKRILQPYHELLISKARSNMSKLL